MRFWMFDRTERRLKPFTCRVIKNRGSSHIVWGRFRLSLKTELPLIMDDVREIKKDVSCVIRSRNSVEIGEALKKPLKDHMVAVHMVLPDGFKGKCVRAANGRRVLCDYKKKSDSPDGCFSVMALLYVPENEITVFQDSVDGYRREVAVSNTGGFIEIKERALEKGDEEDE